MEISHSRNPGPRESLGACDSVYNFTNGNIRMAIRQMRRVLSTSSQNAVIIIVLIDVLGCDQPRGIVVLLECHLLLYGTYNPQFRDVVVVVLVFLSRI